VGGDTLAVVSGLKYSTTALPFVSKAGAYPITPFGASATNYVFNYKNGTLTIREDRPHGPFGSCTWYQPDGPMLGWQDGREPDDDISSGRMHHHHGHNGTLRPIGLLNIAVTGSGVNTGE